ncbi:hypothetical protein V9T40_000209 [Parthenolecanium corni]|uniref:Lipase domain-containing protein n=1 Tax=Parthenolecanium corni TaxID=536013 RepID=A0AAN9Y1D6_9HEMI
MAFNIIPPIPTSINQTKNIFGSVQNNFKKNTNKVEAVVTNTTSGLKNLTEIEKAVEQAIECYTGLGCFPNSSPWFSLLRPFPKPMKPTAIDTKIYLYTSKFPKDRYVVTLWDNITVENSDFDPNRPYTAFVTHGFSSNGNVSWVSDLKDAYLKNREANVFIVDWGKGASVWNYLQVAANTRVVGAELARFLQYLIEKKGLDPSRVHLMGHSLGAHISAYAAKAAQKVGLKKKVAQLTAFDPAQPGFEANPDEVRLVKSDAEFVDVIHTNSRPVIPLLGFGLILPTGHIDYYLNGGLIQPGCKLPPVDEVKLNGIADLAKYPVEVVSSWVACSHGKSYLYYTEALLNNYCTFWGRSAGIIGSAFELQTTEYGRGIVTLGLLSKIVAAMLQYLDWLDLAVFVGMLLISAIIGVYFAYFAKEKPNTSSQYLMGGRTMGILPISMSLIASYISGISILGLPAEMYVYGTQYAMIMLSEGFGGIKAVVWTDTFQMIIMMLGIVVVLIIGLIKVGGFNIVFERASRSNRLEFFKLV